MCSRFQIGSKRPLAKRRARMFCAASLPRKWSMRKICSSLSTAWRVSLSSCADFRSVPKGFSMITCERSVRSRVGEHVDHFGGGGGRHAQVVEEVRVGAEQLDLVVDRRLQRLRAVADRHVDDAAREFGPVVLGEVVAAELLAGVVDDLAELLVADLLDRGAEDAEFRHQRRLEEAQHPRQQLAFGEVAGRPEDDDQVRRQALDDPRVHFFGDALVLPRGARNRERRCGFRRSRHPE